jgi:hypothetical protein
MDAEGFPMVQFHPENEVHAARVPSSCTRAACTTLGLLTLFAGTVRAADRASIEKSVRRGVDYLSQEVAIWEDQHHCHSCHHHGDGARALFAAKRKGVAPTAAALKASADWLSSPEQWDHNGPDGPFSDRKLARIQFASALAMALETGIVTDRKPLVVAAEQLARDQEPSGTWTLDGDVSVGGATTYGRALATVSAGHVLVAADRQRFRDPIARCDGWLRTVETRSVIDSSAVLIGLSGATDEAGLTQRRRCSEILRRGQGDDGGWGPFVASMAEPFDTALAILALRSETDDWAKESIARGQVYLVRLQQSDGSWPETTRPTPRESFSQRISTTAWAILALLESL